MTSAAAAKESVSKDMPLPPAPFLSSVMQIEPQWIDYNGHLNMAYYNVMMDRAIDEMWLQLGIGPAYMKERHGSTFTAECPCSLLARNPPRRSRSGFGLSVRSLTRSGCIRSRNCATPPKAGSPPPRKT